MLTVILSLFIIVLDIIAIYDIANEPKDRMSKLIWASIVLFIPILGLVIYYSAGKERFIGNRQP